MYSTKSEPEYLQIKKKSFRMSGESHNGTQNVTDQPVVQMCKTISLREVWGKNKC